MARGSPARIVSPNAAASPPIQLSREARDLTSDSRRTQSSSSGTQLRPATRPKCPTWAVMAPAKANDAAPSALGRLDSRSARRNQNIPAAATAQVTIRFSVQAALPGRNANSSVSG